ncbi:TPA: SDR family oxidoreductase [Klebsiella oxytoca]
MAVMTITGGTAGVGKATAVRFARAGYDVGIIARDRQSLEATQQALRQFGVRVHVVQADVADADAINTAACEIEKQLGAIEVWVNNAMCAVLAPFRTMTHDEFSRVTEVTYLGYVNGTRAALELMTPRDRGIIIQVGSALAYRSIPLQSAYCGAKAAIRGFTDAVRTELMHEKSGVSISMVQMPGLNTPQFEWARNKFAWAMRPVPPVYQPEVAAEAIFNVARRPVRELWVGSSTIQSIVGQFLFPGFLDRLMVNKAWEGQMTRHRNAADRQDYLQQPVSGLHKTHGRFSSEAKYRAAAITSGVPGKALLGGAVAAGWLLAKWFISRKKR